MIDNEHLDYCGQILKIVSNNEDSILLSAIFETLKSNGVKHKDINTSISFLENHYKLIERYSIYTFSVKNDCFRLTPEGVKAVENGLKEYIEDIEYDKYLDRQVKISTIKTSRWAIGISI